MSNTSPIIIYGASDDLVEVEGAVRDEYQLGEEGTRLRLTALGAEVKWVGGKS